MDNSSNAAPFVPTDVPAQPQAAPDTTTAQPQAAPVTDGTQAPGSNGNGQTAIFDSLSDDNKAYLKSQGINSLDNDGIAKLVELNKQARVANKADKTSGDASSALAEAMGQQPQLTAPTQPVQQPVQPEQPVQPSGQLPSDVEVYNFTNTLAQQFPLIADNIISGQLFKDMGSMGIVPASGGKFNVQAVLQFAGMQNKQADLQKQIEDAAKPNIAAIPDVRQTIDTTQPTVDKLDSNSAMNIVLFSNSQAKMGKPVHPQFEQAKVFLQTPS